MLDLDKIDENVLEDIRENVDDEVIKKMSPKAAFQRFLEWNGIIGYTDSIWKAVHSLENAEIKN